MKLPACAAERQVAAVNARARRSLLAVKQITVVVVVVAVRRHRRAGSETFRIVYLYCSLGRDDSYTSCRGMRAIGRS